MSVHSTRSLAKWAEERAKRQSIRPCKLGLEGIVSKRKASTYRSGRSSDWLKMKNSDAPAVKREAEEDWGK
jgi:ATP-dependent DNA ligase